MGEGTRESGNLGKQHDAKTIEEEALWKMQGENSECITLSRSEKLILLRNEEQKNIHFKSQSKSL